MRRVLAVGLAVVAAVAWLAPVASAQAPAPKVTINGLFDLSASVSKNWADLDVTNPRDTLSYSRERGRLDFTGEVGKAKMVWGIELDFINGQSTNQTTGANIVGAGNSAHFDLDTDVAGVVETKWLYLEIPFTGASNALIPGVPFESTLRGGAQPATGHDYKFGLQFSGDFPGFTWRSTFAPNLRSTLTYAQIGERLDRVTAVNATEDFAVLASVEVDIIKGFTIKPTYSYAEYYGGNSGSGNLGTEAKNGFSVNAPSPITIPTGLKTTRHTFGADLRWAAGPFTLEPTFLVQLGDQEIPRAPNGKREVDIRSWIADVIAGFRVGPLNLSGRAMWTPGMEAQHRVANGSDIGYYQNINSGFAYMTGWTEIQTSNIEYNNSLLAGAPGVSLRQSPSYDKYGRIFLAGKVDYQLTPAYNIYTVLNASWTDEKVDTNGVLAATGITNAGNFRGDDRFLGTELMLGQTWRFTPGVALDTIFAYMWTGDAMNHARAGDPRVHDAEDVYKAVARVRFTF